MPAALALVATSGSGGEVALPLRAGEELLVGRSPATQVTSAKCSRKQLAVAALDPRAGGGGATVRVRALRGGLPGTCSSVNGRRLRKGDTATLAVGGTLRLLHDDARTEFVLTAAGGSTDAEVVCPHDTADAGAAAGAAVAAAAAERSSQAGSGDAGSTSAAADPAHAPAAKVGARGARPQAVGGASIALSAGSSGAGHDGRRREGASAAAEAHGSGGASAGRAGKGGGGGGGGGGGWQAALRDYVDHPERHADVIAHRDDLCTVVADKFPKARRHFLVLPNRYIANLRALTAEDAPLLRHMVATANAVAEREAANDPTLEFRVGFHAVPSMQLLHAHVVSQDFDSPCLKTKKHWNSFTSAFFLPADAVLAELESTGAVSVDRDRFERMLKQDLRCHRCAAPLRNMPALKEHVAQCARRRQGGGGERR